MNLMPELNAQQGFMSPAHSDLRLCVCKRLLPNLEWLQEAKEEDWMKCPLSKNRLPLASLSSYMPPCWRLRAADLGKGERIFLSQWDVELYLTRTTVTTGQVYRRQELDRGNEILGLDLFLSVGHPK